LTELLTLPCFQWAHLVVTPQGHPLLARQPLTLAALADYPLITYDATFTGRSRIDRAFERQQLRPDVMLTAIDSDVIKTYVELGLGVGIIAEMAFDPERDTGLAALTGDPSVRGQHHARRVSPRRLVAPPRVRLHAVSRTAVEPPGDRGYAAGRWRRSGPVGVA
jgi:DNA-binding transcriptional LysR family regulator